MKSTKHAQGIVIGDRSACPGGGGGGGGNGIKFFNPNSRFQAFSELLTDVN